MPENAILTDWQAGWETALRHWSRFTQLMQPRWCLTTDDEAQEGMGDSFAMIRHMDHAVVISLRKVKEAGVEPFAVEILAHEIGHHVYCPANLTDHGRMLARMKHALPYHEDKAPFVANLYADLLINDRLQRQQSLRMAEVYQALGNTSDDRLWQCYMRTYEVLWGLMRGTLSGKLDDQIEADARLAARLVRVYSKYWLDGAGRFAALCLPYFLDENQDGTSVPMQGWFDLGKTGQNGFPDGLTEIDAAETEGALHPSLDPALNGGAQPKPEAIKPEDQLGGQKKIDRYRGIVEYGDLLRSMGVLADEQEIAIRYYRERARPHLIAFPSVRQPKITEKLPEGYQRWQWGTPLSEIDWMKSVMTSPLVVPGLTTMQRVRGEVVGHDPEKQPIDLYIGIDCSGSMPNPRRQISYPTLAATIMGLSAMRARARVMACLSGEPGSSVATEDFVRDERAMLELLTGYLGTGYAFGIHRLAPVFQDRKPQDRPCHLLVITDQDIFSMLDSQENGRSGWEVAEMARKNARAGATFVLHMPYGWRDNDVDKLRKIGWDVYRLYDWAELVDFARDFSHQLYAQTQNLTA